MDVGEQVAVLYCGTHALMRDLAVSDVRAFQDAFLDRLRASHKADVLEPLGAGKLDADIEKVLTDTAAEVVKGLSF